MNSLLDGPGFLGTHAPFRSDASLLLILLSILLLTVGWRLRIRGYRKPHCLLQTVAAFLNAAVVAYVMIGVFWTAILPGIPSKLLKGSYGITALHGLVGAAAVGLGLFVVLRANGWVPKILRFNNYKLFMRSSYILYCVSAALGLAVYLAVYIGGF